MKLRYWGYSVFVFVLLLGEPAAAAVQDMRPNQFDLEFWFRGAMAGLLGLLIYIAKGSDVRIKELESKVVVQLALNGTTTLTVEHLDARVRLMEHEQKQLTTLVNMQREIMFTKYHDKEDTERHRTYVETSLRDIYGELEKLREKLAVFRATNGASR